MQIMELSSWNDFKILVASKGLLIQYTQLAKYYDIFAPESTEFLWHIQLVLATPDALDFETNVKPTANAPLHGQKTMLHSDPVVIASDQFITQGSTVSGQT